MTDLPWAIEAAIGLVCGLVLIGFGYWLGRRSNVERAIDREWQRQTGRPRLNDQTLADTDDRGPANPGGGGNG